MNFKNTFWKKRKYMRNSFIFVTFLMQHALNFKVLLYISALYAWKFQEWVERRFLNSPRQTSKRKINVFFTNWVGITKLELHAVGVTYIYFKSGSWLNHLPVMSQICSVGERSVSWESRSNLVLIASVWDLALSCGKIVFSICRYGAAIGSRICSSEH